MDKYYKPEYMQKEILQTKMNEMNTLSKIVENHDTIFDTNKMHSQNQ